MPYGNIEGWANGANSVHQDTVLIHRFTDSLDSLDSLWSQNAYGSCFSNI